MFFTLHWGKGIIIGVRRCLPKQPLDEKDVESRCEHLLGEIDRVRNDCDNNDIVESNLLQQVDQIFTANEYLRMTQVDSLLPNQATTKRHRNPDRGEETNCLSCRACKSISCKWVPYCDADVLAKRRKELFRQMKSANDDMKKKMSEELLAIGSKLKLSSIDEEIHHAYTVSDDVVMITIKSIHGFPVTLRRVDAIAALEHEANRHVGSLVAKDVVDNILQWMLEGWYFGQYCSQAFISFPNQSPSSYARRGSLFDKANHVQLYANTAATLNSMAQKEENKAKLLSIQTTTKYALFCLTFSVRYHVSAAPQLKFWHLF